MSASNYYFNQQEGQPGVFPHGLDMQRLVHPSPPSPPPPPLRLPTMTPLLTERMQHFAIEAPSFAPIFDRIFVYPLDIRDQVDKTAGGIIIPDEAKARYGAQRGVLLKAGPKAIEQLYGHGVELGHIVVTARLSPWERKYSGRDGKPHRVLVLRASEVVGSEDLAAKYESGELYMEMDQAGCVALHERTRVDPPENDEGI